MGILQVNWLDVCWEEGLLLSLRSIIQNSFHDACVSHAQDTCKTSILRFNFTHGNVYKFISTATGKHLHTVYSVNYCIHLPNCRLITIPLQLLLDLYRKQPCQFHQNGLQDRHVLVVDHHASRSFFLRFSDFMIASLITCFGGTAISKTRTLLITTLKRTCIYMQIRSVCTGWSRISPQKVNTWYSATNQTILTIL